MKLNCLIIIIIALVSRLVSQETYLEETEDKPLYLEFYQPQKIIDKPSIDYDDIEVPYQKYISPEIKKRKVVDKIYSIEPLFKSYFSVFLGRKNLTHSLDINKIFPLEVFDLSFTNTIQELENTYVPNYNFSRIKINYDKIIKSYILGFDINFYNQNYICSLQQYESKFLLVKNFSQNINFTYEPQLLSIQKDKQNFNYYFVSNTLNLSYIPHYKVFYGLSFVPLYYGGENINYMTFKLATRNLILKDSETQTSFSKNNKTEKYYYDLEITKYYGILELEIGNSKKYYYEYIRDYLIKYPEINFNNFKFFILDKQDLFFKTVFGSKNNNIFVKYNSIAYDYFPTYIFSNGNLDFLYKKDIKYSLIIYGLNFEKKNFLFNYNTDLLLNSDDILFIPKQQQEIKLELRNEKVKFTNIFIFNDKMLINENKEYLQENIIFKTELEFLLASEIRFNILYNLPIKGKYYLQPNIYLSPSVLVGVKINFN